MMNIENLKKQAKTLVRLHEQQSYHLAFVAREVLPRFKNLTDREILGGAFKLSDAQELLGRQHGFESWAALKASLKLETSSDARDLSSAPVLRVAQPVIYVADVERAADFYERSLGFRRLMIAGEPPFYAEVGRDSAVFSLRLVHPPVIDAMARARASETTLLQTIVAVTNAKDLFLKFQAAEAKFHTPLRREPWGAWFFCVEDVDANLIGFSEATP